MQLTPREVWWKYIPAARMVVKNAAKELLDHGASLQLDPMISPWKEQFDEYLCDYIYNNGYGIDLRKITNDELSGYTTLLDGIVHTLGIDRDYDGSLSSIGKNLPETGCIVWLKELSEKRIEECFALCAKFSGISGKNGFPRLCLIFESDSTAKHKGVKLISADKPAHSNIRYFVYRLLTEANLGKMTEYAVAVVLENAEYDVERCGELCTEIMETSFEEVVQSMSGDPTLFFAMHRAQIRTVEPLIQIGRLQLCQRNSRQIRKILPITDDYKTTFNEPYELELRHLFHHREKLLFSYEDDRLLYQLYNARNDLSHQKLLSLQMVRDLIEMYQ